METNVRTSGTVAILELRGDLTLGSGEEKMREAINQLLAADQKHFLINLAEVPMIDSSGVGALIKAFTSVKKSGGKLKLLRPSRPSASDNHGPALYLRDLRRRRDGDGVLFE